MAQSDGTFGSVVALVSCALQKGIAAALVQFVYQRGETIVDYDQWVDTRHSRFFARLEWSPIDADENSLGRPHQDRFGVDRFGTRT